MPDADWWRVLWPDPEAVLRRCGLARGMSAIDLCCGDGWFTVPMCRMLGAGAVHGLDLLAEMIGAAKRAHERARVRTHREGWQMQDSGKIPVSFRPQAILEGIGKGEKAPG